MRIIQKTACRFQIMAVAMFLCLSISARCQTATVVIAEVMYDHPFYDNEEVKTGQEGEFMSLYNYEEEEVDISGWRIEITGLTIFPQKPYIYTIPTNTVLPGSGTAVIASRAANSGFDVLQFYGMETPEEADGYRMLYTSSLAFPDTRTRIRVYDAQGNLQDELVYDGNSDALTGETLLRAENAVNPERPLSETVSIQREKIIVQEGERVVSRTDYFAPDPERVVMLFDYILEDYSYTAPPSILSNMPDADNQTLSGRVTENQDHRASNIVSTQVIESGNTAYWAEETIVLGDGFEVKEGVEFEAKIEKDSVHHVKMMTYNLKGNHTEYKKHAQVIKNTNPDVVAVQEVRGLKNFKTLKEKSGYEGKRFCLIANYGIGMLWQKNVVGAPLKTKKQLISVIHLRNETDGIRGFLVIEFREFCFISTHLSLDKDTRKKMVNKILESNIVKDCIKNQKPVYVAGDMNEEPHKKKALLILEENDYEMLNNEEYNLIDEKYHYTDSTRQTGAMIDFIYEYNKNPYHKTIERGVPIPADQRKQFFENISDHLPYKAKVKIR